MKVGIFKRLQKSLSKSWKKREFDRGHENKNFYLVVADHFLTHVPNSKSGSLIEAAASEAEVIKSKINIYSFIITLITMKFYSSYGF